MGKITTKVDGSELVLYINGKEEDRFVIKEDKTKSTNFSVDYDSVIPAMSPNQNGNMMWRVAAEYNGQHGAIYIPMVDKAGEGIYNQTIANVFTPKSLAINTIVDKFYNNNIPPGSRINIETSLGTLVYVTKTDDGNIELNVETGGKTYTYSDPMSIRAQMESYIEQKFE
jgi:hypothetical protein